MAFLQETLNFCLLGPEEPDSHTRDNNVTHLEHLNERDCQVQVDHVSKMQCQGHEKADWEDTSHSELPIYLSLGLHPLEDLQMLWDSCTLAIIKRIQESSLPRNSEHSRGRRLQSKQKHESPLLSSFRMAKLWRFWQHP